MVARDEEIGTAMIIESMLWHRAETGDSIATFQDFDIFLGYCPGDYLGYFFDDNFEPGSRTLVFHSDELVVEAGPETWFEIVLEQPFWYDGQRNLLFELSWSDAEGSIHTYLFNTPMNPVSLKAPTKGGETGFLSSMRCQFMLQGQLGLVQDTFGGIKVLLGIP